MPWLPEDWIDEVVSRNDIVDVVSEYITLKPSGRGYFGLCPFHSERLPPSMCLQRDNYTIVLDAAKEAMLFPL